MGQQWAGCAQCEGSVQALLLGRQKSWLHWGSWDGGLVWGPPYCLGTGGWCHLCLPPRTKVHLSQGGWPNSSWKPVISHRGRELSTGGARAGADCHVRQNQSRCKSSAWSLETSLVAQWQNLPASTEDMGSLPSPRRSHKHTTKPKSHSSWSSHAQSLCLQIEEPAPREALALQREGPERPKISKEIKRNKNQNLDLEFLGRSELAGPLTSQVISGPNPDATLASLPEALIQNNSYAIELSWRIKWAGILMIVCRVSFRNSCYLLF